MNSLQGRRLKMVTWLVTGALFMEILDGNIIATVLPQMSASFGVDALRLNVAISAYLLALGVCIPVSGWLADRYGPKYVFAGAITGFTLSSLACGLVQSLEGLIALRILQGASGALMVPVGRLLVLRHTPQHERMAAMSNLIWPALVAPVIAPPLGGFIAMHASWQWIFFLNVPLGLLGFFLALSLIPPLIPEKRRDFDWLGFALCGSGMFATLSGLERLAGHVSAVDVGLLVVGCMLLTTSLQHFRKVRHPMLDLSPMRIATFRAAMLGGSISRMAIGSLPFLLPLMLQIGYGFDAIHAGLFLLVVFIGNLSMKMWTTPILRRFGYRPVLLVNGILAALAMSACAFINPKTSPILTSVTLLLCGMTRSMQFTSIGTLAFADVPDRQMTDANALSNVISQLGMAAGVTLGALCVKLGEIWAERLSLTLPAASFKIALIMVATVALLGLLDTLRLPKGAGDDFVGYGRP